MKHFLKRTLSMVASLSLVATMALGTGMVVSAEGGGAEPPAPDPLTQKEVKLSKDLLLAEGITIPKMEFKFKLTSKTSGAPAINDITLDFEEGDGTLVGNIVKATEQYVFPIKVTDPVHASSGAEIVFPKAGIYEYEVKEDAGSSFQANPQFEHVKYGDEEYTIKFYVTNGTNADGSFNNTLILSGIGVFNKAGEKINPETDFRFTNVYRKVAGSDGQIAGYPLPTDAGANAAGNFATDKYPSYVVAKNIKGDMADFDDTFSFTLDTVLSPTENADDTHTYPYYVMEKGKTTKTFDGTLTIGSTLNFTLKHNQYIVFQSVPAGTKFYLEEVNVTNYKTSAQYEDSEKTADVTGPLTIAAGAVGAGIKIGTETEPHLLAENKNYAEILNTYQEVSITGIVVENLPFVIMITLAGAGLVAFLAYKKRREA